MFLGQFSWILWLFLLVSGEYLTKINNLVIHVYIWLSKLMGLKILAGVAWRQELKADTSTESLASCEWPKEKVNKDEIFAIWIPAHYPTVGGAVCIIFQRALCKHFWALYVSLCIQRPLTVWRHVDRSFPQEKTAQAARAEPHICLSP